MFTRIALFALALALPLAACEQEPADVEGDTITIETPDVEGAMDDMGAEAEAAADEIGAEAEAAADDIDAAVDEAGAEMEEAADEADAELDGDADGDGM